MLQVNNAIAATEGTTGWLKIFQIKEKDKIFF